MTELKLEVGKTYTDGDGNQVSIVRDSASDPYRFVSSGGGTYTSIGRQVLKPDFSGNLVSEYTPPAAAPQPAARTPLVHAEQRHDHANGWDIEFLNASSKWVHIRYPSWNPDDKYRRKPEVAPLKPNEVIYLPIWRDGTLCFYAYRGINGIELKINSPALRIEWNPNDQTLVSATVVML